MRLPKTSRTHTELKELRLGTGDYAAGGARSPPFLELDNARRRRPLVFGEITDDLASYPETAASMFSGRQKDPVEWAVMWKEIGADGICVRITGDDHDHATGLVSEICRRTRLPVIVDASHGCSEKVRGSVKDSILIVFSEDVLNDGHLAAVHCMDADEASDRCGKDDAIVSFPLKDGSGDIRHIVERIESYRNRGLEGDATCSNPVLVDVSGVWDRSDDGDVRKISMHEAVTALAVMMAGADIVIVKGPGAADMARVYGEELADL